MPTRQAYLDYIRTAGEHTKGYLDRSIQRWHDTFEPDHALFGYAATGAPAAAAAIDAFLYEQTGDQLYARRARQALLLPRELSSIFPAESAARHPEYHQAVPPMDGLFVPPNYIPAYERVRESDIVNPEDHAAVAAIVADSLHPLFHFPEWGAHNRTMLRALSLTLAARAFPDHPDAPAWRELGAQLASDSIGRWSIEDAMGYHAVWLLALFTYAEVADRFEIYDLPVTRYYVDYFAHMMTPLDTFPDFGDATWGGDADRLLPCFERAAALYRDPRLKCVADRMFRRMVAEGPPSLGNALLFMQAYAWADDSVHAQEPEWGSEELLEDLVGKKVIFRTGWDPDATYLLLNYRDELGYGRIPRRYLRTTLAVSAEKMHHGHADENSIVLLLDEGAVLLHDGGYREGLPNGRYRADIYHNRVIWRPGIKRAETGAWDALHDDGSYKVVRTEKLHFVRFDDPAGRQGPVLSRTRVTDERRGIAWDRVVVHIRALGCFILIDGVRALVDGPFTLANVLYTQRILDGSPSTTTGKGDRSRSPMVISVDPDRATPAPLFVDTSMETIADRSGVPWQNPQKRALLIVYPLATDRPVHVEKVRRHYQEETGLFQVWTGRLTQHDIVPFVTVLWPHDRRSTDDSSNGAALASAVTLPAVSASGRAVAVRIRAGDHDITVGCKLDLNLGLIRRDIRPRYTYQAGRVRYGDIETDATHVYTDVTADRVYAAFTEGTRLAHHDRWLYDAESHRMFQEDGSNESITPSWREVWQGVRDIE